MNTEPNWSKAPADAQFFMPENDDYYPCWVKKEGDVWFIHGFGDSRWFDDDDVEPYIDTLIPRPDNQEPATEYAGENDWL